MPYNYFEQSNQFVYYCLFSQRSLESLNPHHHSLMKCNQENIITCEGFSFLSSACGLPEASFTSCQLAFSEGIPSF